MEGHWGVLALHRTPSRHRYSQYGKRVLTIAQLLHPAEAMATELVAAVVAVAKAVTVEVAAACAIALAETIQIRNVG